jgi:hypothetical protein
MTLKRGTLTITTTLHHYMHMEDPELIADGIRHVLAAAQQ